jgi:hypothetical protein
MRIGKPLAIAIAFVTLLPAAYMAFFFASFFAELGAERTSDSMPIFGSFETMMVFHLSTMLLSVAILLFYLVHAFRNQQLAQDKRVLWVILLFFGSFIAAIIYWFVYIWRAPVAEDAHRAVAS